MNWSQFFLPTLREDPKDSDSTSYRLMVRAGLIRRLGSGAYSYLPFGLRALQKTIAIVREEMNSAGAQELLMPVLQPLELWKTTGREALLGEVLIRFKDRTGRELVLGPTHEEVVTSLLKEISSHKQLPAIVYQIQTKFRDEPRPRSGVIRSKEFLMKDAYSFDVDENGLARSYQAMYEAYERIFSRCALNALSCEADPGIMGGDVSHEFMAPAESGEDQVVRCKGCGYAANLEAARCGQRTTHDERRTTKHEVPQALQVVETPGKHTVEQVSQFLKVSPAKLIKTLLYDAEGGQVVAVLVRGDHDVNEAKLARLLKTSELKLSSPETIQRVSKAPLGFTGPVKLGGIKLLADETVTTMVNAVTGANAAEAHMTNVNPGRDFKPHTVADLRMITKEDVCPKCKADLEFVRCIEVGHVFKLGAKYSYALGALIQNAAGKRQPMIMGCYGIGVNRILAAAIEQHHDEHGIIWPVALSPFQVVVTVTETANADLAREGQEVYSLLRKEGFEVLLDDRDQSAGSKLKDADLVGIPLRIVVGKVWLKEQELEAKLRGSSEQVRIKRKELVKTVHKLLDTS